MDQVILISIHQRLPARIDDVPAHAYRSKKLLRPIALLAPFFDARPLADELGSLGAAGWFAIIYNIFLAGTVAHWAWFHLARTLPVAVSSLSSLPVPVVGVFAGIVVLGEKPGPQEWIALTLVVIALFIVLSEPRDVRHAAAPLAPDD